MKHHPSDLGESDLQQRVAPELGHLTLPQLFELDFPPHDYTTEAGRFWRAETVREAVSRVTRGELNARPSELRELAGMVRLVRRAPELSDDEAREAAIQFVITGRLRKILDRWPGV